MASLVRMNRKLGLTLVTALVAVTLLFVADPLDWRGRSSDPLPIAVAETGSEYEGEVPPGSHSASIIRRLRPWGESVYSLLV